ncbi:MAG: MarR family winged helix-turn-helix transcriptional regulator [Kiritimatiellia bacterium]
MKHDAIMLMSQIYAITHQWLTDELASAGMPGIVPSHGDILACLFKNGPTAMHELAAFSRRTRPTTTVLVDKLEQMGLIRRERSEDDARSFVVTLTEAGESLRGKFESISRRLVHLVYSPLDKDDAETFEALLGKILANLQQKEKTNEGNQDNCGHCKRYGHRRRPACGNQGLCS